jgi:hypothetical protein
MLCSEHEYRADIGKLKLALSKEASLSEDMRSNVVDFIFETCKCYGFEGNTACAALSPNLLAA